MATGTPRGGPVRLRPRATRRGCAHAGEIGEVTPHSDGCAECMKSGERISRFVGRQPYHVSAYDQ